MPFRPESSGPIQWDRASYLITENEYGTRCAVCAEKFSDNKTLDAHVSFLGSFMMQNLPLISDTNFPSLSLFEDEMANDNPRFQSLENGAKELTGRVKAVESGLADINWTLGRLSAQITNLSLPTHKWTITTAIAAVFAVIATFTGIWVNYQQGKDTRASIEMRVDGIDKQVVQLRTILRMLSIDPVNKALDDAIVASQNGDASAAKKILVSINAQATLLKEAKVPAEQDFFTKAVSSFQTIAQTKTIDSSSLNSTLEKLASYRSVVIFPGNRTAVFAPGSSEPFTPDDVAQIPQGDGEYKGFKVSHSNLGFTEPSEKVGVNFEGNGSSILVNNTSGDLFHVIEKPQDAKISVSGVLIISPSQTLDGFQWKNVIFMNAHIVYRDGPVKLDHVAFVNCTFEVAPQRGEQLLDYALLGKDELLVGGSYE